MKTLHIVNGNSAAETLKFTLKRDNLDFTNAVYCFNDFLSVGPLYKIETKGGQEKRKTYLLNLIRVTDSDYSEKEITDDISGFLNVNFDAYDKVNVWHGKNSAERILKYLCCSIIETEKLYETDLSKLQPAESTPIAAGACSPEDMKLLLNRSNKINREDHIKNAQKWVEITSSTGNLRIFEFGEIKNVSENFYDQLLIEQCTNVFTPALKVVGMTLGKTDRLIGDIFIKYRLLHLIKAKKLEYRGDLNNFKTLLVRKP